MSTERHTNRINYLEEENRKFYSEIHKLKRKYNYNVGVIQNLKKKRGDCVIPYPDFIE